MEVLRTRKFHVILTAVLIASVALVTVPGASGGTIQVIPPKYVYSVKFICNPVDPTLAPAVGLVQGLYSTDINVHNPSAGRQNASISENLQVAFPDNPVATAPPSTQIIRADKQLSTNVPVTLEPNAAMRLDCTGESFAGGFPPTGGILGWLSQEFGASGLWGPCALNANRPALDKNCSPAKGFIIIYSNMKLDVVAEYTALVPPLSVSGTQVGPYPTGISIDTQYIQPQFYTP